MKKGFIISLILITALLAACASGGAPKEPVSYKLYVQDAVMETPNGRMVLDTSGDAPTIGYWEKLDDVISWEITVEYSCDYEVSTNYSLDPQFDGSVVEVRIGDQVIPWTVKTTDAWGNYTTKALGTVSLEAGTYPVVMQAVKECEGDAYDQHFIANIRKVTLTTVAD